MWTLGPRARVLVGAAVTAAVGGVYWVATEPSSSPWPPSHIRFHLPPPSSAAKPETDPGAPTAASALQVTAADDRARASNCLALAIYYEARGEVREGQQAVAQVVLNRVRDPIFPKTICGVVFQGEERPTGCQFSFTCDGSMDRPPRGSAWKLANTLALAALDGFVLRSLGAAVNYHNHTVTPFWSLLLTRSAEIGGHIFYTRDQTAAAGYRGGEPLIAKALLAQLEADGVVLPVPPVALPAPAAAAAAAAAQVAVEVAAPAVIADVAPPASVRLAELTPAPAVVSAEMAHEGGPPPPSRPAPSPWFGRSRGSRDEVLPVTGGR